MSFGAKSIVVITDICCALLLDTCMPFIISLCDADAKRHLVPAFLYGLLHHDVIKVSHAFKNLLTAVPMLAGKLIFVIGTSKV